MADRSLNATMGSMDFSNSFGKILSVRLNATKRKLAGNTYVEGGFSNDASVDLPVD